jgi:hypothetical protein
MAEVDPENVLGRTRADNASYVLEQVRALGLNPDRACRLMAMHRALSRGYVLFDDPDFPAALDTSRQQRK